MKKLRTSFEAFMTKCLEQALRKSIQNVAGGGSLGTDVKSPASAVSPQRTLRLTQSVISREPGCDCHTVGEGCSAVLYVCVKHRQGGPAFKHLSPIPQTTHRPRTT